MLNYLKTNCNLKILSEISLIYLNWLFFWFELLSNSYLKNWSKISGGKPFLALGSWTVLYYFYHIRYDLSIFGMVDSTEFVWTVLDCVFVKRAEERTDPNYFQHGGAVLQDQLSSALWQVAGPLNAVSCVFNGYIFPMVIPKHETVFPEWKAFCVDFVLLALVADFGLYWGHRIQHGKFKQTLNEVVHKHF